MHKFISQSICLFVTIVSLYDNIDFLPSLQEDFDFLFDLLINIYIVLFSIHASYREIYRYFLGNDSPRTFSFSLRKSSFFHDLIIINILFYFIICIYIYIEAFDAPFDGTFHRLTSLS